MLTEYLWYLLCRCRFVDDRGSITGEVADTAAPAPSPSTALMVGLYPDLGSMSFEKDSALNFTFIIDRYALQCSLELA